MTCNMWVHCDYGLVNLSKFMKISISIAIHLNVNYGK